MAMHSPKNAKTPSPKCLWTLTVVRFLFCVESYGGVMASMSWSGRIWFASPTTAGEASLNLALIWESCGKEWRTLLLATHCVWARVYACAHVSWWDWVVPERAILFQALRLQGFCSSLGHRKAHWLTLVASFSAFLHSYVFILLS